MMIAKVKPFMEEAGWYENRRISIDYMLDDFKREGFKEPNELIKQLLAEFWNLKIERITSDGLCVDIRLNTDVGIERTDIDVISHLERIVGIDFLPVGTINGDHAILLLSFEGKFYLLSETGLFFLGNTIFEACRVVLFEEDLLKIAG